MFTASYSSYLISFELLRMLKCNIQIYKLNAITMRQKHRKTLQTLASFPCIMSRSFIWPKSARHWSRSICCWLWTMALWRCVYIRFVLAIPSRIHLNRFSQNKLSHLQLFTESDGGKMTTPSLRRIQLLLVVVLIVAVVAVVAATAAVLRPMLHLVSQTKLESRFGGWMKISPSLCILSMFRYAVRLCARSLSTVAAYPTSHPLSLRLSRSLALSLSLPLPLSHLVYVWIFWWVRVCMSACLRVCVCGCACVALHSFRAANILLFTIFHVVVFSPLARSGYPFYFVCVRNGK